MLSEKGSTNHVVVWLSQGEGMLVRDLEPEDKAALQQQLAERYMAVDLQREGLRIHSMDPPIFTIQNFLAGELCEAIAAAADASGGKAALPDPVLCPPQKTECTSKVNARPEHYI